MTDIRTDSFLPHPREKVWRALTDPDLLAAWLMPNDFRPVVGHRFTFRAVPMPEQGFDGVVRCEVLALEPPQLLRISWSSGRLDTVVTWQLVAEGRGTRLFLTHEGFDETDPGQAAARTVLGGGWRGQLPRRLGEILARIADAPGEEP
jgi:uncharacterized protein YndB with AHSA1/START domain